MNIISIISKADHLMAFWELRKYVIVKDHVIHVVNYYMMGIYIGIHSST